MNTDVSARMREDWNARADEDAHYYVAFGRRDQNEDEFLATADEVVATVEWELKRNGTAPRARRGLEIGCGPGRLMKRLAHQFGEIHGVDVSDKMIALARERLRGVPHAHVHATDGAELAQFADESFDLVYSYAVFQHIPDRDVIMRYLEEIRRVLKPGGLARLQFNGLPRNLSQTDTWSGVRLTSEELVAFARPREFQVLAMEGESTQYMWTTWRKREPGWRCRAAAGGRATLKRVTNAFSSEPVVPNRGRFASVSMWMHELPDEVDLFDLTVLLDDMPARPTYIGPKDATGLQQVNAVLPESNRTGLVPLSILRLGRELCDPATVRVIPAGPDVPCVVAVTDGVNLLSDRTIQTGTVKVSMEEVARPEEFTALLDDVPVENVEWFCTDPLPRRYEINFRIPDSTEPGRHVLRMCLGRRRFAPISIEVLKA